MTVDNVLVSASGTVSVDMQYSIVNAVAGDRTEYDYFKIRSRNHLVGNSNISCVTNPFSFASVILHRH